MPYVTSIERIGMKKGMEKGMEKGLEKGIRQGAISLIRGQLSSRFGKIPVWVNERLEQANMKNLELWAKRILDAGSLEEIFE